MGPPDSGAQALVVWFETLLRAREEMQICLRRHQWCRVAIKVATVDEVAAE